MFRKIYEWLAWPWLKVWEIFITPCDIFNLTFLMLTCHNPYPLKLKFFIWTCISSLRHNYVIVIHLFLLHFSRIVGKNYPDRVSSPIMGFYTVRHTTVVIREWYVLRVRIQSPAVASVQWGNATICSILPVPTAYDNSTPVPSKSVPRSRTAIPASVSCLDDLLVYVV